MNLPDFRFLVGYNK